MAESKSSLLAKSVQKHAGRAKEKLLQNLGKVDRTADEIFDEHLTNFNRQQTNANRLQKEFNNYIRCIRAVQTASKTLMEAICDVYETPWSGAEALHSQVSAIEVLWQDFSHKLGDQVLIPLNTYTAQFPEMKKKIEKRNRKLIDYDSQRHSFQSLQANSNKRRDDVKVTKGREQLEEARRTYEILNTELHDELPALHDSRILFLVTNLQTLFASEQVFHNETSKIYAELEAIVDKLATDSQRGSYTIKKLTANANQSSPPHSPTKMNSSSLAINANISYPVGTLTNGSSNGNSPSSPPSSPSSPTELQQQQQLHKHRHPSPSPVVAADTTTRSNSADDMSDDGNSPDGGTVDDEPAYQNAIMANGSGHHHDDNVVQKRASQISEQNSPNANTTVKQISNNTSAPITTTTGDTTTPVTNNANKTNNDNSATAASATPVASETAVEYANGNVGPSSPVTTPATTTGVAPGPISAELPPGVLYRVKATYKYVKEDVDELSFEVGDTIQVIEYDDPEDQEEGWLMGTKEGSTEKGLFPANFTRPL